MRLNPPLKTHKHFSMKLRRTDMGISAQELPDIIVAARRRSVKGVSKEIMAASGQQVDFLARKESQSVIHSLEDQKTQTGVTMSGFLPPPLEKRQYVLVATNPLFHTGFR